MDADDATDAKQKPEKGKPEKKAKPDDKAKTKPDDKPQPAADPGAELPKAIDLLYLVNGEGLFASAGFDPKDSLRNLARAPSGGSLAQVASMASALSGVGSDASFVLVADALRIDAMSAGHMPPGGAPAPVVIAAGRTASPGELWGRFDVPVAVIQQLVTEYTRRRAAAPAPQ
jgi:hypothetical protein